MPKVILTSDWHFGDHHDSEQHNLDLIDFVEHIVRYAKNVGITDLIHLGDFFDNWMRMGISTENYALYAVSTLKSQFSLTFLKGNHDLPMQDSRTISSLEMFRNEVRLVDDTLYEPSTGILYASWLCSEAEYEALVAQAAKTGARFVLGHFQFITFEMNDGYPVEVGQNPAKLSNVEHVFTGHYHKRQEKGNVTYVGSPFPFDYSDANDLERGFLVLDTDTGEYEWVNYPKIKILSMPYKDFLNNTLENVDKFTTIRIVVDEVISDETTDAIQKKIESLSLRGSKIHYLTNRVKETILQEGKEVEDIKNLDELVIENIKNMTAVVSVDQSLMIDLYRKAMSQEAINE